MIEIRARGANRCTGRKRPRLLPAFPRAGLTGPSINCIRVFDQTLNMIGERGRAGRKDDPELA